MFRDKIKVKVYVESFYPHLSQIYSGFQMLSDAGIVSLKYKFPLKLKGMYFFVQTEINGKHVIFHQGDDSDIDKTFYKSCDFYFKRMIQKNDFNLYDKLHPLGFNLCCFSPNY